jgi:hypothetical protein
MIGIYLLLVELVKRWFYKRYSGRLEQLSVPVKGIRTLTVTHS